MGGEEECGVVLLVQFLHEVDQCKGRFAVQVSRRFIGQNQGRFGHYGTGYRNPLLLSA